ncbi:unnamed protein product [Rhizoctonia solani]|uniref:Protein kinase domain-containing protein n=1 Tax=Rhizoctonia solani TaxID=456999 RepID=A0A8H2ZYW0_9AGAM|nr:unnamed protein product [Rhizoctonia solani]
MGRTASLIGHPVETRRLSHEAPSSAVAFPAFPNRGVIRPHSPSSCTNDYQSNTYQIRAKTLSDSPIQAFPPTSPKSDSHVPPIVSPSRNLHRDDGLLASKPTNSRTFQEMSMHQILEQLRLHGNTDISSQLILPEHRDLPVATGGFGNIYRGALRDGREVAIKCLRPVIHQANGIETLKRASKELLVWSQCNHPNVLPLLGVAQYCKQLAMVSPWMPNGSLNRFLYSNFPSVPELWQLGCEIAESLRYLHEMGIVHGDVKAANILVSIDKRAILAEFGHITIRENSVQATSSVEVMDAVDQSIRWTAPEVLEGQDVPTDKGDIYSLGMASLTILEVLTGSEPYAGLDTLTALQNIISGILPERPEKDLPSGNKPADLLWALLNDCWAYDPQQRPVAMKVQDKMRSLVTKVTQESNAGV